MAGTFEELGSPFMDEGEDFYSIDTKEPAEDKIVYALRRVDNIGKEQ